jgi:hypothetical protein
MIAPDRVPQAGNRKDQPYGCDFHGGHKTIKMQPQ